MTGAKASKPSHLIPLTDDEAVTLRRIAFGDSELSSLRKVDLARLSQLRLIAESRGGTVLTLSGKEHYDALPRPLIAQSTRPQKRR